MLTVQKPHYVGLISQYSYHILLYCKDISKSLVDLILPNAVYCAWLGFVNMY